MVCRKALIQASLSRSKRSSRGRSKEPQRRPNPKEVQSKVQVSGRGGKAEQTSEIVGTVAGGS